MDFAEPRLVDTASVNVSDRFVGSPDNVFDIFSRDGDIFS